MFFDRRPDSGRKRRVTIGALFNPDIGASLRPLDESTRMFTRLVAMVFIAHGLFPREHPAFHDERVRLSLRHVIGTAWQSLIWSKDGLPQILLFAAVVGCLGFGGAMLVAGLASLFIAKAHAQAFAPFQPVDAQNDIALGWMNYLFFGHQMANYLNQYGQSVPQPTIIQSALITALGFYSDAILVVAAVILFYHLASMIVETAHHGVVMGKRANQIWAPIRLVVAVGLLVPVSGGLNCGQYIVIQLAEWGSNLASQTWKIFLNALIADQYQLLVPNTPYVRETIGDLADMEACAYAYNTYLTGVINAFQNNSNTNPFQAQTLNMQETDLADGSQKYAFTASSPTLNGTDVCGYYLLTPQATVANNFDPGGFEAQLQTSLTSVRNQTLQTMLPQIAQFAQTNVNYFIPQAVSGTLGPGQLGDTIPANIGLEPLIDGYQNALQQGYNGAFSTNFGTTLQAVAQTSGEQGWVSAGEWFNTIARIQGAVMGVESLLPRTYPPNADAILSSDHPQGTYGEAIEALQGFETWLGIEEPNTAAGNQAASQQQQLLDLAAGFQQSSTVPNDVHYMDLILAYVDWVASWNGVWTAPSNLNQELNTNSGNFTLGVQFTSGNPLAEIAYFGHANINAAYKIFDDFINLTAVGGTLAYTSPLLSKGGDAVSKLPFVGPFAGLLAKVLGGAGKLSGTAISSIGAVLGTITVVFFTAGFTLAYFLPLIPFFKFLFGIISWLLSLLEAVIAMPLVALAHLNPEGDGLPGTNGKQSYYFLFNIFLRPVLMVFGLIAGLLIFYMAATAMNMMYMTAVSGTGGFNHAHVTLSRIAFSVIYVLTLYLVANNAFKMIDWLPEHCMTWMGAQGLKHAEMGDPTELAGYAGAIVAYGDNMLVQNAGNMAKQAPAATLAGILGTKVGRQSMYGTGRNLGGAISRITGRTQAGNAVTETWQGATAGAAKLEAGAVGAASDVFSIIGNNGGQGLADKLDDATKALLIKSGVLDKDGKVTSEQALEEALKNIKKPSS